MSGSREDPLQYRMPGAHVWRRLHHSSTFKVWIRSTGSWVETLCRGRGDPESSRVMIATSDRMIAQYGACNAFHDWWGVTGYDADTRRLWERWLSAQAPGSIEHVVVLTRSRLLRMGITLANLTYRHTTFVAFEDRTEYDRLRDTYIREPRPTDPE